MFLALLSFCVFFSFVTCAATQLFSTWYSGSSPDRVPVEWCQLPAIVPVKSNGTYSMGTASTAIACVVVPVVAVPLVFPTGTNRHYRGTVHFSCPF